jgi:hypothetical protein
MRDWSVDEVVACLREGRAVRDARVAAVVKLSALWEPGGHRVRVPVQFSDCELQRVEAAGAEFEAPVVLERTRVRHGASFWGGYFFGGLRVEACRFEADVDFQCGGHNGDGAAIVFLDTAFEGFVNFFDCWFEGPVEVRRCAFPGGTNLLGNVGEPFQVRFDVPPVIEGTTGALDRPGG